MFVLLSSAATPRYREDILRCLAAPIGATVQFRYDKVWVAESILDNLQQGKVPHKAMVCYIEHEGTGTLRMMPVRAVSVEGSHLHGSTLSVTLKIEEILNADPESFTNEVSTLSGKNSPQKQGDNITGKYFFELSNDPPSLKRATTLKQWEETVALLRQQPAFQDEPFFWTTLGLQKENSRFNTETFQTWPDQIAPGSQYDLLIYHFQPRGGKSPDSSLAVTSGFAISGTGPNDIPVDSRYDLKRWRFEPKPNRPTAEDTWLRIRTANRWDLDLQLSVAGSLSKTLAKAVLAGLLIATPSILSIVQQKDVSQDAKWATSILSAIAGIAAAIVFIFKIERYG